MTAVAGGRHTRLWLLAGLLAVSATVVIIWDWVLTSRLELSATGLDKANRELEARVGERQRDVAELTAKLQAAGEIVNEAHPSPNHTDNDAAARVEAIRKLAQLQTQMQALNASIAAAVTQNQQLEAREAASEAERQRLAAATDDSTNKLTVSNRTISALQDQIKANTARLDPLEAENQRLQVTERAARARLAAMTKLSKELADIRKRRQALIESAIRHYRELGDQYRTLIMRLDSAGSSAGTYPGDLSRIQAALSEADDDLRQLSSLNQKSAALNRTLKF
ncbi:MAG: hypothetical protein IT160_01280 [Bryobacterales bacterium]|nr:hypothetical protein [Bryobacterales bacterium]